MMLNQIMLLLQAAREDRIAEKKAMLKQQREFNRKKEYARQCRVKVCFGS